MSEWQPIETAPKDRQFLATDWDKGDSWNAASIEVLSYIDEDRFLKHNSACITRREYWYFWMEKPEPPK